MMPSGAKGTQNGPLAPTVLSCRKPAAMPDTLRKRADFLRAAAARRQGTPGFMLQARLRAPDERAEGVRIGYTCSKKVGNSVVRNRARRRLREVARAVLPHQGRDGWDYVLVGRPGVTVTRDFAALIEDMNRALARIHADTAGGAAPGRPA
ncbi:ribonuclease P protein component [Rhodobacteraceae bacterium MBR-64]